MVEGCIVVKESGRVKRNLESIPNASQRRTKNINATSVEKVTAKDEIVRDVFVAKNVGFDGFNRPGVGKFR